LAEPLTLLFVEDSDEDARLIEAELRRQGFDPHIERVDTERSFDQCLQKRWDAILSDYTLPGFGGREVLARVAERRPDLPVIFVSGRVGEAALVEAVKAGAADYVVKDDLARLAPAIRRELRAAAAQRQQRETERLRLLAEERFRFVVERTGEVLYSLRFDTMRYDYMSAGIERLIGYTPEEINQVGFASVVVAITGPASTPPPGDALLAARTKGEASEFWSDYQVRTKSGELRWLADHSYPWRDDAGRLMGSVGVLSDITARRGAEQAMRDAQQRLEHVVSSSQAILRCLKPEGDELTPTWVSPNIERLLGFTAEEALAPEWWSKHVHPEDLEDARAQRRALFTEGHIEQEFRFRNKPGEYRWWRAELRLLRDAAGTPAEVISSWSDVSARKRAELRLEDSEQQYRLLFDGNPSPMNVIDRESQGFLAVNDAAVRHYGFSREEFLALTLDDIRLAEGDASLGAAVESPLPRPMKHRRKDGSVIDVEVAATPIVFGGRPAWLALVSDVTERKSLEAQLLQSQRMESVGRLAGGVAHDFNNWLGVITGYGELLRKRVASEAHLTRYADEILSASQRAAGLTRQLLAFSRKQVLQPRVLDLNTVIGETETMLRRLIGEDVQLVTVLDRELGAVRADPAQFDQVLMNLVVNARDAMPRGGRLTIETRNVSLDAAYARQHAGVDAGEYVMLAVSDTGHGMPPQVLARIFDPFFTTKERDKGTGLGLSMVHGIVKQSGGHIWVYSEPGYGSTFKVYLPRIDAASAGARVVPEDAEPPRGSETILLVEDAESLRGIIRESLEESGYTVHDARTGAEAVEICKQHAAAIDLLITDVVLPGMNGRELSERVRAIRPAIRTLYMSGYTDDAVVLHEVLGANVAFLQKPFTVDALVRAVREGLDAPAAD
jgi:PAS domain S-box-containing protein